MFKSRRSFVFTLIAMPFAGFAGCGGGADTDVSKPVEVTDELERQARAADEFFESEKSAGKKNEDN